MTEHVRDKVFCDEYTKEMQKLQEIRAIVQERMKNPLYREYMKQAIEEIYDRHMSVLD